MSHPPTQKSANVSPGEIMKAEDASTQMTDEDILLQQTRKASTQTTDEDFILPETTQYTSTQISKQEFGAFEQGIDNGNNPAVTSENSKQNRKRNVSSEKMLTYDAEVNKRSRSVICRMSGQGNLIWTELGGMKANSRVDTSATTGRIEMDNSRLTGIYPEFRNVEELHSQNQGVQKLDEIKNKKKLNTGKNTASNINISQNENVPDKVSDSEGSKGKIAISVDVLAVPGPSRPREDIPQSYVCLENFQSTSRLIWQTVAEMKKTSMCFHCEKDVAEHVKAHNGKNVYKCCECKYTSGEKDYLVSHICTGHLSEPFFCNICRVRFAEVGSHESENPCNVCKEKFRCITQLEDHYLAHEQHHSKFCRLCESEIDKHVTKHEDGNVYKCCQNCPREFYQKPNLLQHLYIHSPFRLFKCHCCGDRFSVRCSLRAHYKSHSKCEKCGKIFVDTNSLAAHCLEEHC